MRMEKIVYRSRVGDLDIPAFVFQPLHGRRARNASRDRLGAREHPRPSLRAFHSLRPRGGRARAIVVIAPEYRGSIGYGKAFYDAIDYGGAEVDDVVTAVSVLRTRYPGVDPARIGIIGWSHGGLIALLAVFRNPTSFKAAAAIVPVANLFQRFAWKGEERLRADIDPQNRLGGLPAERRAIYRDRSPLFHVDKLQIPLLVHIAENDEDVNIEEALPLVDALRARKPSLADTKVYRASAWRPPVRSAGRSEDAAAGEHGRAGRFVEPRLAVLRATARRATLTAHRTARAGWSGWWASEPPGSFWNPHVKIGVPFLNVGQ